MEMRRGTRLFLGVPGSEAETHSFFSHEVAESLKTTYDRRRSLLTPTPFFFD